MTRRSLPSTSFPKRLGGRRPQPPTVRSVGRHFSNAALFQPRPTALQCVSFHDRAGFLLHSSTNTPRSWKTGPSGQQRIGVTAVNGHAGYFAEAGSAFGGGGGWRRAVSAVVPGPRGPGTPRSHSAGGRASRARRPWGPEPPPPRRWPRAAAARRLAGRAPGAGG